MFIIPTGFTKSLGRPIIGVWILLALCTFGMLFVLNSLHQNNPEAFVNLIFTAPNPKLQTWLTHLILPADAIQLLFTLFFLGTAGSIVEGRWTIFGLLAALLLCGAGSAIAVVAIQKSSNVILAGPTGAITGILVISFLIAPKMGIELTFMMFGLTKFYRGTFPVGPFLFLIIWAIAQFAWHITAGPLHTKWPAGIPGFVTPIGLAGHLGGAAVGLAMALIYLKGDLFKYFRQGRFIPIYPELPQTSLQASPMTSEAIRQSESIHRKAVATLELKASNPTDPKERLRAVTHELCQASQELTRQMIEEHGNADQQVETPPDNQANKPSRSRAIADRVTGAFKTLSGLAIVEPKKTEESPAMLETTLIEIANKGDWKTFYKLFPKFFKISEHYKGDDYLLILAANQYSHINHWVKVVRILERLWLVHPECDMTDQIAYQSFASMMFGKKMKPEDVKKFGKHLAARVRNDKWRGEITNLLSRIAVLLVTLFLGLCLNPNTVIAGEKEPDFRFCIDETVAPVIEEIVGRKKEPGEDIKIDVATTAEWKRRILKEKPECDLYVLEGKEVVYGLYQVGPFKNAVARTIAETNLALFKRKGLKLPDNNPLRGLSATETGRLLILNPLILPAGIHTEYAIKSMGLWDKLEKKLRHTQSAADILREFKENTADFAFMYRPLGVDYNIAEEAMVVPIQMVLPIVFVGVIPEQHNRTRAVSAFRWLQKISTQDTAPYWSYFKFFPTDLEINLPVTSNKDKNSTKNKKEPHDD